MSILDEFYQDILKKYKPNCNKCNEPIPRTTPLFKLQFTVTTIAPSLQLVWLAEHKQCKPINITFTKEKDE